MEIIHYIPRLLTAYDISLDESSLTGETEPVSKHSRPIQAEGHIGPSQMKNIGKDSIQMVFAGVYILHEIPRYMGGGG